MGVEAARRMRSLRSVETATFDTWNTNNVNFYSVIGGDRLEHREDLYPAENSEPVLIDHRMHDEALWWQRI